MFSSIAQMLLKNNRVLVVYKDVKRASHRLRTLRPHWVTYAQEHEHTIVSVAAVLRACNLQYRLVERSKLQRPHHTDLIIAIGGDGTVLATAHIAGKLPVLGVNSMPQVSVGFFCATTAKTFAPFLRAIIEGKKTPTQLPMLRGTIDGQPLAFPALNDILFASNSPADSVYYRLRVGRRTEIQRSSGVWIAAGPGSTAGFRSAGGKPAQLTSDRIRYIVREPAPIPHHRYALLHGAAPPRGGVSITSEGGHGMIYVDGSALIMRLRRQQILTVSIASQSLLLFTR